MSAVCRGSSSIAFPGPTLLPGQQWTPIGEVSAPPDQVAFSLVNTSTLANGGAYTYLAVAAYADGVQSDPSNLVTIIAVNDAPTIVAIPNQTIVVNTSAGPLNFTVGDEDPASVTVAASSSNTALVPTANIVFAGARCQPNRHSNFPL